MSYTVDIKGLKELQAKFDRMPVTLQTEVRGVLEAGCKTFVRNAQRDAPKDMGFLGFGITYAMTLADKTHTSFEVVSNAEYSPYIEWGTITRAKVPPGLEAYASQWWTHSKKNGGIYPHPFFFKQIPLVKAQIETQLGVIIREEKL